MMLNFTKTISIFLILQLGICFSTEITGPEILEKSIKRMDGIDHIISVEASTYKKNDEPKTKILNISVHYGEDSKNYKMIYLEEGSNGSKGRELLIHEMKDKTMRTWVKYPKSGKVKEVKDKKLSKKIDISEITIPLSFIDKPITVIGDETVNDISCKVIEVINEDEKIKLWIDLEDFIVHRKEYYDKKSKLYKSIVCTDLVSQDKVKFYKNLTTKYLKDKTTTELVVSEFKMTDLQV